jgi:hypothetical protein
VDGRFQRVDISTQRRGSGGRRPNSLTLGMRRSILRTRCRLCDR